MKEEPIQEPKTATENLKDDFSANKWQDLKNAHVKNDSATEKSTVSNRIRFDFNSILVKTPTNKMIEGKIMNPVDSKQSSPSKINEIVGREPEKKCCCNMF